MQGIASRGVELIELMERGKSPNAASAIAMRNELRAAQRMQGEVVIAAAYPLERLLDAAY